MDIKKIMKCQEPAWNFPPMAKVMRRALICKGESGLEGPPHWICLSVYPQTRVSLFYCFMTFTNSSDSHGWGAWGGCVGGWLSPTTLSLKEINLEL